MSDPKPDPLSDVIRGLGLLLRAAKTTVERVPTKGLEDAVIQTAREVGRAIENVAETVEREVLGRQRRSTPPGESSSESETEKDPRTKDGDGRDDGDPKRARERRLTLFCSRGRRIANGLHRPTCSTWRTSRPRPRAPPRCRYRVARTPSTSGDAPMTLIRLGGVAP